MEPKKVRVPIHIKDIMDVCNHMVDGLVKNGFPIIQARKVVKIYVTEVFDPDEYWDKELIMIDPQEGDV